MNIHFVLHEAFEAPGAIESWAHNRGYATRYSRIYDHEPLPQTVEEIDFLIIMGGPQCPSTTTDECPHFDASAEVALISRAVAANRAVLGVCLGAQLIGEALGAKYEHSPEKEIGKFPIVLTPEGLANEKIAHFGRSLQVGHWHSDMPGLTPDSTVIAFSEGCPRQIVEYSKLVYGFQCHLEFNRDVVELLIAAEAHELRALAHHRFVQQPDELRRNDYAEMNRALVTFLDKLARDYYQRMQRSERD